MRFAAMQLLTQRLNRYFEQQASSISDSDVEKYYEENAIKFERAADLRDRIKQVESDQQDAIRNANSSAPADSPSAVLNKYCVTCHNTRLKTAGLMLDTLDVDHVGNNAEDLAAVAEKLDKYPNMYVDIDARISELGRQPFAARKFFLKYQDRIMFGTDTTPRREAYRVYYRFLETEDEYFDCSASHHRQGFWNIDGSRYRSARLAMTVRLR